MILTEILRLETNGIIRSLRVIGEPGEEVGLRRKQMMMRVAHFGQIEFKVTMVQLGKGVQKGLKM